MVLIGLSRAIQGREQSDLFPKGMIRAIYDRVFRIQAVIQALMAAFLAGALPVRRSPVPAGTRRMPETVAVPAIRLPGNFAWLFRLMPAYLLPAGELQLLLDDPEMRALLAASPRAVRTLKPLCRMLGVTMPKPGSPPIAPVPPAPPDGGAAAVDTGSWSIAGVYTGPALRYFPEDDDGALKNWA